ncbi:uncharacterized protein BDV17DRAFT_250478 [Aspergillus undulatus]|uniref:uncharacterized protein n=1 Tax=Aspergillus undulatus TaxID=1810928 RepID=UPI003CCCB610
MDNSALVPSDSGPSFAQQGTVDWTQLAKSSLTLSLEVLSRLNQAGVESFTLAVGQAVFSPFLIPPDVQRKIQFVLGSLRPFSSYGNILWFGFGIKHVVRLLVESEQGVACVALCGGLSVSYDKFYCAQVLRSMTEFQSTPSHLRPSISQWSNLINVCSGTLATSDFPNIVEGFCRLWHDKDLDYRRRRGATPPTALAEALTVLSAVSGGALHSATFAGGPDCAWVAALAEWVLCLTVEVLDAETGQCLYQKLGDARNETPRVRILRTFDVQSSMIQIKDKTCFLPTGADILRRSEGGERCFSGGRSTWDSILADSFPAGPLNLLFSPEAAPAFSSILHHAAEKMDSEIGDAKKFLARLPELKPILTHGPSENQTVEEAVKVLRRVCFCASCGGPPRPGETCIPELAKTILEYLWLLSHLNLHENILPSPSGLRHLLSIHKSTSIYDFQAVRIENTTKNCTNILANILHIMTGMPYQGDPSQNASALSSSGIAVCCGTLLDPSSQPASEPSFHVVPGHVQKDDTIFHEVYDLDTTADSHLGRHLTHLGFEDMVGLTVCNSHKPELKFIVKETIDGRRLQASYVWQTQKTLSVHGQTIQPIVLAFGSAQLQRSLFGGPSFPLCKHHQIKATIRDNTTMVGTCSQVSQDIFNSKELPTGFGRPRPGQWILQDVSITQRALYLQSKTVPPAKVYMGSIVELYSLLCSFGAGTALRIARVCSSGCLFCTCPEEAREIVIVSCQTSSMGVVFAKDIGNPGTQTMVQGSSGPNTNSNLATRPRRGMSF